MNISELSIRRPVLASVLTIIILLFGLIGYSYLGVREFPSVDNPIISVSCSYPGANADVIENQITEPLEQNINGIPGIRSLSSVSSQGQSRITVEFELSVDLETAANDVRDKVSRACDPPDRDQGRRRRLADSDGHDPERQAVAARIERDRRPDGQGAVADHQRRERRADLGRKTLLDAPVARPREDGRLRHHPDRHQDGPRPRERRTAFGQHRGQHHGADDPHDGTDAHHAGVQRPGGARRRRPHHPHERRGTRRTGSAGHAQLHENERHSDGGRRRDPPAGRQPHQDCRCRLRTHGTDEEGPAGRCDV